MKHTFKRFLSLTLAILMVFSMFTGNIAYATEGVEGDPVVLDDSLVTEGENPGAGDNNQEPPIEDGADEHEHEYVGEETLAATCTAEGVMTYTCECGNDSYTEAIPVMDHPYVDGVCSVCGNADPDYVAPANEEPDGESWYDAEAVELTISTVAELQAFAQVVTNGTDTFVGKTVKLGNSIDLSDIEWSPIGNDTNYFMGTFDGDTNTISNMTIDIESEGNVFAGLFGGIKKATVKNLTMKDVSIDVVGAKVRAAAVAGIANCSEAGTVATINFENITVDGCTIKAEARSGSALLGGVVGYSYPANMNSITVSDLTIDGKAEGNEVRAAAINGYVCGQNISNNGNTRAPMLVDTFNVSDVTITAEAYTVFAGGYAPYTYYGYITLQSGKINDLEITVDAHEAFVGGLVGYFWRSDNGHTVNNVDITDIYFDVITDYLGETRIGGVVGTSQSPNTKYTDVSVSGKIVERCSDSENSVNYHAKVGGFVARTYEYAQQTYTNCVADVDVIGSNIAGGFVGNHNSTVSYVNCEAKGDVTADIAGGFAGRLTEHGYTTDVTFDNCKASGVVTGTNVAGGFIGSTVNHGWAAWAEGNGTAYGKNITLKDCVAAEVVTTTNDTRYCAGVVGEAKVADGKELTLDNVTYTVNPAVYPEPDYIAKVDEVGYTSLKEAIEKANGAIVTLIADTTENITIADNATVVINLGGKTLNGYIAPCTPASLTISNGSIVNTNSGASAIEINAGNLTLTDVNIDSARHAVRIDGAVTATIDGGTYKAVPSVVGATQHAVNISGSATVTIKNGTFVGPKGTTADSGAAVNVQTGATVTINGGNFSGGKNNTLSSKGTLTVKGGTYDQDPSDYVADGYVAIKDESTSTWTVGEAVAKIGTKGYVTLKEAVDAANAIEGGATVILLDNVTLGEKLTITGNVVIDGDNHTLTWADGYNGTLFDVTGGLTVTDLTIDGENAFTFYEDTTTVENGQPWYTRFVQVADIDKGAKNANVIVSSGNLTLGEGTVIQNVTIASDGENGKTANTETGGYYLMYNDDLAIIHSTAGSVNLNGTQISGNAGMILNAKNTSSTINSAAITGNMGCGNKGAVILASAGTMSITGTSVNSNKSIARSAAVLGVNGTAEVTFYGTSINDNEILACGSNCAGAMVVVEGAGRFVMEGGSISNNVGGRAGAIASRWVGGNYGEHTDGSIAIRGGDIDGNTTINADWGGASLFIRSDLDITGGTIDGIVRSNSAEGNIAITGGTFFGELVEDGGSKLEVTGGTFGYDPSSFVPFGYASTEVDGVYTVAAADEYEIWDKEDLYAFAAMANAGNNFSGKTVKLMADIDLGGAAWTPIKSFAGNFLGNEHTISNFKIDATASNAGFFNTIAGSNGLEDVKVKDLILSDVTATVGNYRFGTLANSIAGVVHNVTVQNVTVTTTNSAAWVGGMAAFMDWPWMTNCTVENLTVNAEAGAELIAGFACILQKNSNHVFENLDVNGFKVTVNDTDGSCGVAGFVGQTQRGWENPKVIKCDVTGIDVTASGTVDVGGFIAWPGAHTIAEYCTTEGKIDVTGVTSDDCFAGGFFGNLGWNADLGQMGHVVTNCSADVEIITKVAPAGGFVGSATNSDDNSMYATFTDCSASGDVTCVEGGAAPIGGFAGDADRGVYNNCSASCTVTNNGTGDAGQFIGAFNDVTPEYDYRYPAGTRDYLVDESTLDGCTYTGASTTLPFIGNIVEGADVEIKLPPVAMVGETGYPTLKEAVAAANAIEGGATVELLKDVTLGEKLTISGNVTISGEKTITRDNAYTGTLFTVNAGATLTLDGGLVIDGANNYAFNSELYNADLEAMVSIPKADAEKYFTPEAGAPVANAYMITLTKGTSAEAFGGTVNLNKVTIQNNYSINSGIVSAAQYTETNLNGATISHVAGTQTSGVVVNASGAGIKVNMNEGTVIDGNHVGGNHGVFKIYSGTVFTMNGGEVKNTTGWNSNGVAVGLYGGTFIMNGGTICSNSSVWGSSNGRNAAIYLHSNGVMEMNGGSICHNTGISRGGIDSNNATTKLTITGGEVVNNVSLNRNSNIDVGGTVGTWEISGGTFTQDVTAWLAPDTGLTKNSEGKYTTTNEIYEYNGTAYQTMADVIAAIKNSSAARSAETPVITVLTSHKIDDPVVIDVNVTLDLNGKTITGIDVYPVIRVQGEATVTIADNGEGSIVNNDDYVFVLGASDGSTAGNLTIESGKYHGATTVASVTKGLLNITGGEFSVDPYEESYAYLINCIDANYKDGSAKVSITGGTFHNWNPQNNAAEGAGTNFVAEGFTSETKDEGAIYTVRPFNYIAQVGENLYESLQAAINADGEVVILKDFELSEVVNVTGTEIINGNGCTLTWADGYTGTLLNVDATGDLTVTGLTIDGENEFEFYNHTTPVENGQPWYTRFVQVADISKGAKNANVIVSSGNLTLGEGTVIQNVTIASDDGNGKTENTETGYILKYNDDLAIIYSTAGNVSIDNAKINGNAGMILNAKNTSSTINSAAITGNMGCGREGGLIALYDGSLEINNSNISGNKAMARCATILGVTTNAEATTNDTIIDNNRQIGVGSNTAGSMIVVREGSTFTMNGGSISNNVGGRTGAIASRWADANAMITLNSGTITGNTATNGSWNDAAIFLRSAATIGEGMKIDGVIVVNTEYAKLDITGGNFSGGIIVADGFEAVITGGTFNYDPTAWVAEGFKVIKNGDDTYSVEEWDLNIYNAADMMVFARAVNAGNTFDGKTITVMDNIDMSGINWIPVGGLDANEDFKGEFNGNGKTISNLTIELGDQGANKIRAGLFASPVEAYIHDFYLTNVTITGSGSDIRAGALAGNAWTGTLFENITVSNVTMNIDGGSYLGGVAGRVYFSNMSNVDAEDIKIVNTSANTVYIGGFTAYASGHTASGGAYNWVDAAGNRISNSVFTDCDMNVVNIEVNAENGAYVGGFVADNAYNNSENFYVDCNITGLDIDCDGNSFVVGGFIARNYGQSTTQGYSFKDCSVQGFIDGTTGTYGGFVGLFTGRAKNYAGASADVDITCTGTAGGFVGKTAHSHQNNTNNTQLVSFTDCAASGDVKAAIAGGFVGDITIGNDASRRIEFTATNCSASGAVTGTTVAGGFAGQIDGRRVSYADSYANLTSCTGSESVAGPENYTAGMVGYIYSNSANQTTAVTFTDCVYTVEPMYNPVDANVTEKDSVAQIGDEVYYSIQDAVEAAEPDATIVVIKDHAVEASVIINKNVTLDLGGKTITTTDDVNPAFRITNNANVTVKNGKLETAGYCFILGASDGSSAGSLIIEDGTYHGTTSVASVTKGNLTINGGEFSVDPYNGSYEFLLNCIDANYKDGADIVVKGGTFVGFNPENNAAEGEGTNFVADGYVSMDNGDDIWTVCAYVAWIKAELLAGNDVTLEHDIVIDGSLIESIPAPTNSNGKYPNYGIFNVVGDYDVTFDLNGHTITYEGHADFEWNGKTYNSCTVAHGVFFANYQADLTVIDSSEDKTGTVMVYGLASGAYVASPNTTFTIKGGTWKNEGCKTCGGTNIFMYPLQGGELYIEDGYFEQALDSAGDSYLLVEHGGDYKNSVIDYSKTKLEISGGTFVGMNPAEAKYFEQTADNKLVMDKTTDMLAEGYAAVDNGDGTYGVKPEVVVTFDDVTMVAGNELPEFTWTSNFNEVSEDGEMLVVEEPAVTVNGVGEYEIAADAYVFMSNKYVVKVVPGKLTVVNAVAMIGETRYATLADATAAAQDGDTIEVISDIALTTADCILNEGGYSVLVNVAGKSVTIDLNGKAITVNASAADLANAKSTMLMGVFCADTNGKLTLKDSIGNGSVSVTANDASVYSLAIAYEGLINIESGSYFVDEMPEGRGMIYGNVSDHVNEDGSNKDQGVNISGGTFTLGNVGDLANGSPWIFATAGSNTGKYIYVTGGTFNDDIAHQYWIFEVVTSKEKALIKGEDNIWSFVEADAYVNEQEWSSAWYTNYVGYATLEEALNAAEPAKVIGTRPEKIAETVTLLKTVEVTGSVVVKEGTTLDCGEYSVVLASKNATLTAAEGLNVITNVVDCEVAYKDGVYYVVDAVRVAKIGDTEYKTLAAAIAAAKAGDTITLIADVTENVTINKNLTIDGAEFKYTGTMTANSGLTVTVQNVNFVNGGIDKTTKSSTGTYTIKDCTFDGNGTYAYPCRFRGANKIVIENCTVKNYLYSFLYVYSGTNSISVKNVTVEDCPNYAVYFASGVNSATIENLTVKNSNNGFLINNTANRAFTIKNCTMEDVGTAINHANGTNTITCTVLGANDFGTAISSEYAKYVLAAEDATLTAPADNDVTTNVDGCKVVYENGAYKVVTKEYVAQIGDAKYETLQDAVDACVAGDNTITLLADIDEDVTIKQVEGVDITIDGAQKTYSYSGTFTIHGSARYTGEETLTFQNMLFTTDKAGHYFIDSNSTQSAERYAHNVTVKGCYFGAVAESAAVNSAAAVRIRQGYNIKFVENSYENLHSAFQGYGCSGVAVEDVNVKNCKSGFSFGTSTNVTVVDSEISVTGYGLRADANSGSSLSVENTSIDAFIPISVRNVTKDGYTLKISSDVVLKGIEYEVAFASNEYEYGIEPVKPTGAYTFITEASDLRVFPTFVAAIGETEYVSIQDAVEAAQDGDTIVLLKDITLTDADMVKTSGNHNVMAYVADNKSITLDMNGKTINVNYAGGQYLYAVICVEDGASLTVTGNGGIDIEENGINVAYMFWKRGTTGALTIENGTYHMDNSGDSMVYTNGHEIVTVKGGTWTLDKVGTRENRFPCIFNVQGAGDHSIIVTGGTFNDDINHQHWGNEAVVPATHYVQKNDDGTWTVKFGAVAYVNQGTLTGPYFVPKDFGYATFEEACVNADIGNTITLLSNVTVESALVIKEGATVNQGEFEIVLTAAEASLTAGEGLNVTTSLEGYKVVYENGVYKVVSVIYVAQIGDIQYETLEDAINAATAGQTITLIADVTENVTINKNLTIDGAEFKYTGTMTANSGLTVTVQNVNFVNGGIDKTTKSTTGTYTIKNCTFDGNGTYAYPCRFRGANKIVIENCTVKNYLYSFLYVYSGTNSVSVKNVTVEDCPNYAVYFASGVNSATFENLTVKNSNNGFLINNTANRAFTIKNCTMEDVGTAINHANGTNTITCTVLGANDFGTAISSEYAKYVLAAEDATLTAPEGYNVTTEVADHKVVYENDVYKVAPKEYVAEINGTEYESIQSAVEAAEANDVITVLADHTVTEPIVIAKDITLDLGDKTITGQDVYPVIRVQGGADVTVKNGEITNDDYVFVLGATDGESDGYLTIEGGKYHGATTVASVTKGKLTITGGEFSVESYEGSYAYLLNCIDANYNDGTAKIEVKGGTFHDWNPADNAAEGAGTNFCADGYISKENNGVYTVVKALATIDSAEDLVAFSSAVTNATLYKGVDVTANPDAIVELTADIDLADVNFLPIGNGAGNSFAGTFDGGNHTIRNMTLSCDYYRGVGFFRSLPTAGTVVKNLTFENANVNNGAASGNNHFYGVVAGFSSGLTLDNVDVRNSSVTFKYSGAVMVGCLEGASVIKNCDIENVTLTATDHRAAVYGILGNSVNGHNTAAIENCTVNNVVWIVDGEYKTVEETIAYADIAEHEKKNYVAQIGETKYTTLSDAVVAAVDGDTITLIGNVKRAETLVINKAVTLDLNSKTVSAGERVANAPVIRVLADVTVTNGTVDGTTGTNSYAFIVGNSETAGTLNIADGTYKGITSAISITKGTVNISGGTFSTAHDDEGTDYGAQYLLNCLDAAYMGGTAKFNITGGTFVGFNPKNNAAEGEGTNFVAEGYAVNEDIKDDGVIRYTVVDPVVEMDGKYYATIKDALWTLSSADTTVHTVKVLKDHEIDVNYSTYNYPILVNGFAIELDLNGKTITADWSKYTGSRVDNAIIGVCNGGKLDIIDSVGGGKIVNNDDKDNVENRIFWIITSTADKSIEVNIKAGTFVQNDVNTALLYVQGNKPSDNLAPIYVSITGGHFETVDDDFFNAYDGYQHDSYISGGTFNKNPSDWEIKIADGFKAVDNGNGIWAVKKEIVVTMNDLTHVIGNEPPKVTYTYEGVLPEDEGKIELVIELAKELDFASEGSQPIEAVGYVEGRDDYVVTVDSGTLTVTAAVAKVDEVYYDSVQDAVNAAVADSTVELVADREEDVTIDKNIVLEGGANKLLGEITVADGLTLTIHSGTFDDMDAKDYVVDGMVGVDNGDGTWTVKDPVAAGFVARNMTSPNEYYKSAAEAMSKAKEGDTVIMIADSIEETTVVVFGATLDLNGFTVEAPLGVAVFAGNIVDNSNSNAGLLKVAENRIVLAETNEQLPVWTEDGYKFVEVQKFNEKFSTSSDIPAGATKYVFQPFFETSGHDLLMNEGVFNAASGITFAVRVTWTRADGTPAMQDFVYTAESINGVMNSYVASADKYSKQFALTVKDSAKLGEATYQAILKSDTGVIIGSVGCTAQVNAAQ